MTTGESQTYSHEDKRDALALAEELGQSEAARELGIPVGTMHGWAFKARKAREQGTIWPAVSSGGNGDVHGSGDEKLAGEAPETASPPQPQGECAEGRAKPAKKVAHMYAPSQRAAALELVAEKGIVAASKELGIARSSLYDWKRRVKRAAQGNGESPTTGPDPADIETQRDNEILSTWKQHPGLGPSQIKNQLRRAGTKVATQTVRRVMEDAGYRPPKVKRHEHTKSFEAVRPNHMWHLDYVHRFIGRATTFTLILIDDCSRFVVGHGVDDAERADMVIHTFERAVERHGKPELVMHDKGSAFWSWNGIARFTRLLEEMNVEQIVAPHKEWNGKVEVFNANLHKELFDAHRFYDVAEMKRRLATHLHWYNHRRTHHALGGLLVPADRYFGRNDEVLARIESGAAADDAKDVLSLRERVLELFKVTSTNGQPEVWLMGQKLLRQQQ